MFKKLEVIYGDSIKNNCDSNRFDIDKDISGGFDTQYNRLYKVSLIGLMFLSIVKLFNMKLLC